MFSGFVTWVSSVGVFSVCLFVFKGRWKPGWGRGMNMVKVYDILEWWCLYPLSWFSQSMLAESIHRSTQLHGRVPLWLWRNGREKEVERFMCCGKRQNGRHKGSEEKADVEGLLPTLDQGNTQSWAAAKDHVWVHGCTTTRVHYSYCYQSPQGCQGSGSPLGAILVFRDHVATGDMTIWVADIIILGAMVSSKPQLLLRTMSRSVTLQQSLSRCSWFLLSSRAIGMPGIWATT